jgi:outer membrane protein assembly factor BamA
MGKNLLCWLFLCFFIRLHAQSDEVCHIGAIGIKGARQTKEALILREIQIQVGDTFPAALLPERIETSRQLLINTGLFTSVHIYYKNWQASTGRVELQIDVNEGWYLYPVPVFDLADRNFNVWWVEQARSFQRVNYGMDFSHLNFSGNNDKLKAKLQFGYTRKFNLRYQRPFINPSKTLGMFLHTEFSQNREINYATLGNKQAFWRDEDRFVYSRFRSVLGMTYRPGVRHFHYGEVSFHNNQLDPFVADTLNPEFFIGGRTLQRFFSLAYEYSGDFRDIRAYPMEGHLMRFKLQKDGLGFFRDRNALTLTARLEYYTALTRKWSIAMFADGKYSFIRERQPYNDNRALGFGRVRLPGYEYYIADGQDLALARTTLRYRLIDAIVCLDRLIPMAAFQGIPFNSYFTINGGWGIIHDPWPSRVGNPLNNRPLWCGGVGLNFVVFYNKVLVVEYSVNHMLEKGLFLHLNMNI